MCRCMFLSGDPRPVAAFGLCRWLILLCLAALVRPAGTQAQVSLGDLAQLEAMQNTLAAIAETVRPSVVAIRTERRGSRTGDNDGKEMPDDEIHNRLRERVYPAVGSGVIISADGCVLTNEHVILQADPENILCILSNGQSYRVQGITSDPRSDLAVLRIDARDLQPIKLGDAATVKQGHFAIVMGNPFGSASDNYGRPAMSFGVISALGQELTRQLDPQMERYYGNLIQTDARINPGNSGGPLLNMRGELIGINTAISTRSGGSEGVGYAIPLDTRIKEIIDLLEHGREVEYGYLGVELGSPSRHQRESAGAGTEGGALVKYVWPDSPAASSSLQSGDVIVEYDGRLIRNPDELVRMVGSSRVGARVDVTVYRERRRLNLTVVPGRRESDIKPINTDAPFDWRGMRLVNLNAATRSGYQVKDAVQGVLVTEVQADSPARKAGLEPGTVIRQVGDITIESLRRLRDIAPQLSGPLELVVVSDGEAKVTLP